MSLVEFNWNPAPRQLRQFAVIGGVLLPLLGWWWGASAATVGLLLVLGCGLAVTGYHRPALVRPAFLGLMLVTTPIGLVAGELVLLLIYFALFLPLAMLFRLTGRDALLLRPDHQRSSWWQVRTGPPQARQYYRQF